MTQFLEEWISTRLGASIDFSNIGHEFFDGKLFFKILQSYDIVGPEVKQYFCRAKNQEQALRNLNLLRVTFKLLGVLRNENVLDEISKKNGQACVDLLNQLYLKLSNKHALPLITEAKKLQVLRQETGRFKVSKVLEKKCKLPPTKRPEEKLLARIKASIKAFDNARDETLSKKSSGDRLKEVSKQAREEIEMKIKECKCGATVEECLMKFDERIEQLAGGDNERSICPPDEYVKMLKLRTLKQSADKEMENKLRDIIVRRTWCKQMEKREEEFRCSLADKLLKQSNYEREMALRLGKVHLQHRIMTEKRRQIHVEAERIYAQRLETIEWRNDSSLDLDKQREKQRLQDLHRKIYSERVMKARNERLDMIKDIVNDLVDFSLKMILFKSENVVPISRRELKEWKIMFFKSLPLLPLSQEVKLKGEGDESLSEESFDSLIEKDEQTEEVLSMYAFNEYLILLGPWTKELWPELENVEEEMQVLGFAVHRLLEFKYPLPLPPEPADVPMYPVRVVLNNFSDVKKIKILKSLLEKPCIEVIELPVLINTCIAHYKKEVGLDVKPSKKKDKSPPTDKKTKKKNKEVEPKFKDVELQYPSLPDLEPKLSKFSELGKKAFEILGTGSAIPDDLIVDIIIEFLRNLNERQGWVLVNFPADCRQLYHMESKFTGLEPPIKCILKIDKEETEQGVSLKGIEMEQEELINEMHEDMVNEDFNEESECDNVSKLEDLRTSRLVPRPNPLPPTIVFESYFTHFIQLEVPENVAGEIKTQSVENTNEDNLTKESSLDEQTPKLFYENMDIYLEFPYNKLDLSTLKRLARAIIDESDEPGPERKTSVELFGDVAKEKSKKDGKASKTKTAKQPPSEILVKQDSLPEGEFDHLEEETLPIIEESLPCQVAEPCWEFTTLDIPDENKLALASFWENIEYVYTHNLMELFSFFREHDASLLPYRNIIYKKLAAIIEEPDQRQELVTDFQCYLNSIDDILRAHGEVKKDVFCRIFELQLKLWELCDIKKTMSEAERLNIIKENWLPKHLCEIFNIDLTMMETEVDRFTDSIQFLNSYYFSSLGKSVPSSTIDKWSLPRYKLSEFEPAEDGGLESVTNTDTNESNPKSQTISKKSIETKREIDVTLTTEGIADLFETILSNSDYNQDYVDPMTESMNEIVTKLINEITDIANHQFNIIEKERKHLCPAKSPKSRAATAKKKATASKIPKDTTEEQSQMVELEEEAKKKDNYLKAIAEWTKAVQNELDRTVFRLHLIKNRFINDLTELLNLMMETFHGLHNEISKRYFEQTRHCDDLLRVLMASVEAETRIDPKLILTLEHFYIEPDVKPVICGPPPPVTPIEEVDKDFTFTVEQLKKFAEKMKSVAPLGVSVESLIAMIEDMVLIGKENGYPYLPKGWAKLNRSNIRKVIRGIFGDIVLADWKDLLIFGLEFRFPSILEIIEARDQFMAVDPLRTETVKEEDFNNITLWFEQDLCDTLGGDLRVVLGKQFLFDLYRVDSNSMNYTAFLLNYCKDENPIEGFGKALALATGYGYVLTEENRHLLIAESEKKESLLIVKQIINILLQDTLNRAEGIVITEVDDDGNPINNIEEEFVKNDFGFFSTEKLLETSTSALESILPLESRGKRSSKSLQTSKSRPSKISEQPKKIAEESFNFESPSKSKESESFFSKEKTDVETMSKEDSSESLNDNRFWTKNIVWKTWLPKGMVMSLLLTSFQSYALPENMFYIQKQLEEQVNLLYWEKGTRDCIEGHILAQSAFIRELFTKCFKFKSCDLPQLIKTTIDSNRISSFAIAV